MFLLKENLQIKKSSKLLFTYILLWINYNNQL